MTCGRGIEDDDAVFHGIDLFHDFGKVHCFIDTRDRKCQILHHSTHGIVRCVIYSYHSFGENYFAQSFLEWRMWDRFPWPTSYRTHSPYERPSRTSDQMHLKDCALISATAKTWEIPGSVLMRRTDSRTLESWTASEQDVVVLPTPPLPPQNIHFRDF